LWKTAVTVYMNGDTISRGLNENYTENKKLDMLAPPGFPLDSRLLPAFFAFREVRSAIQWRKPRDTYEIG